MFKVYKLAARSYLLSTENNAVYGDLERICKAMRGIGVDWEEIEAGLCSLEVNNHDMADYGLMKTFIFSMRTRK